MLTLIMDNYCKARHCLGVEKIPHSFCHRQLRATQDDQDGENPSAGWLLPVIHFHRGTT